MFVQFQKSPTVSKINKVFSETIMAHQKKTPVILSIERNSLVGSFPWDSDHAMTQY